MTDHGSQDLPEGVIDAMPAGGWESGAAADGETAQRSGAEASEAALPSDVDVDEVQSADATQGLDPDMTTDEEAS